MRSAAAQPRVAAMFGQSVNLLTGAEYEMVKRLAPHDADVPLDVWAAFLTRLLGRPVNETAAADVINEYNARLRAELS